MHALSPRRGAQTLRGNIRVVCRVRPPAAGADGACAVRVHDDEPGVLTLVDAARERQKAFEFNDVAGPTCTQEDVWQVPLCHAPRARALSWCVVHDQRLQIDGGRGVRVVVA